MAAQASALLRLKDIADAKVFNNCLNIIYFILFYFIYINNNIYFILSILINHQYACIINQYIFCQSRLGDQSEEDGDDNNSDIDADDYEACIREPKL